MCVCACGSLVVKPATPRLCVGVVTCSAALHGTAALVVGAHRVRLRRHRCAPCASVHAAGGRRLELVAGVSHGRRCSSAAYTAASAPRTVTGGVQGRDGGATGRVGVPVRVAAVQPRPVVDELRERRGAVCVSRCAGPCRHQHPVWRLWLCVAARGRYRATVSKLRGQGLLRRRVLGNGYEHFRRRQQRRRRLRYHAAMMHIVRKLKDISTLTFLPPTIADQRRS